MSIYLPYFALDCEPFSIVPDPGFLYPSHQHRQAVAHLKYGLDREGGFVLLSGEVGTGKTTLTRTLLKHLPAHMRVAYVLNSKLEATDVLASICQELAIEVPTTGDISFSKTCIDALNHNLIEAHAQGKKTLVVIEEAQNLSAEVLEMLRLLSNLETATHKLLHILLVGQPELLETLAQKDQRQLNQRVVARFHLLPLAKADVANYVNHRLHHAGAKRAIFDNAAMGTLFRLTKGVPRLINLICHHSLLAAYAMGDKTVSARLVKKAAVEVLETELPEPKASKKGWAVALLVAVLIALWPYRQQLSVFVDMPAVAVEPAMQQPETPVAPISKLQTADRVPLIEPVEVEQASVEQELEEQVAAQQVKEARVAINPYSALFAAWSLQVEPLFSEEEVYAVAAAEGLSAEKLTATNLAAVMAVDRPGIVWINEPDKRLKTYLLASVTGDNVTLIGPAGELTQPLEWFATQWSGAFLYLWQSPVAVRNLRLGDRDAIALDWLQNKLQQADSNYQQLITGGHYNEAIRQQVLLFQTQQGIKADGVVGRQTIMKLNQIGIQTVPQLISKQDLGAEL
jgi:general secretion pathway protein A